MLNGQRIQNLFEPADPINYSANYDFTGDFN